MKQDVYTQGLIIQHETAHLHARLDARGSDDDA